MKTWRDYIKYGLNHKYSNYIIQFLIVISLFALAVQTMNISTEIKLIIDHINGVCLVIFVIEYFLRIYTEKNPAKFIFSFYGIIDIIAIFPYFIGFGMDSNSLRALRLLRIFQLMKFVRYNKALNRFKVAFHIAKEELIFFMTATCIVIYIAAAGIYHFEHVAQPDAFKSIVESLWWAIITLTTVGYGDVYPITAGGKMFTGLILFVGLGIVAVPAGMLASALSEARRIEYEGE